MSVSVGDVVSNTLQRVRDLQGAGHSREFVRKILSHAQRTVNSLTGDVTDETALTLEPRRLIYNIKANLVNSIRVLGVRFQETHLERVSPLDLTTFNPYWPRTSGTTPNVFTTYGRNLLVIYPATETSQTATVVSAKETGLITSDTESMSISDHLVPLVTDMAEITLLIRQRDFEVAKRQFEPFMTRIREYRSE